MSQLMHAHSPLAQTQRQHRLSLGKSTRRLSLADEARLKRVLTEKYEHVHNEAFDQSPAAAEKQVFDDAPPIQKPDTSWYHPVMDSYTDVRSNRNVKAVLLTAKEERALFLQYNYCRFRVVELRNELSTATEIDPTKARDLLAWHTRAENYREQIANTNLALVLAMAKRTRMNEVDFADLVSEGNMALLRAVDKFDVARGFKFSTYACRAILKAFSRAGIKLSKYRGLFPTDFDPALEKSNHLETKRADHEDDCVDEVRRILDTNNAELSDIEQAVIEHRFAVSEEKRRLDAKPLTLEEVGKIIGVTKERVRQIQNKALDKLRVSLEDDFLG